MATAETFAWANTMALCPKCNAQTQQENNSCIFCGTRGNSASSLQMTSDHADNLPRRVTATEHTLAAPASSVEKRRAAKQGGVVIDIIEDTDGEEDDMVVWSERKPSALPVLPSVATPAQSPVELGQPTAPAAPAAAAAIHPPPIAPDPFEEMIAAMFPDDDDTWDVGPLLPFNGPAEAQELQAAFGENVNSLLAAAELDSRQEQSSRKRRREGREPRLRLKLKRAPRLRLKLKPPQQPEAPPILAGRPKQPTTFAGLVENANLRYLLWQAKQRTELLAALFGTTKEFANTWRVQYEKNRSPAETTIWSFVLDFANDPKAQPPKPHNHNPLVAAAALGASREFTVPKNLEEDLGQTRWQVLRENLDAYLARRPFQEWLDSIQPLSEGDKTASMDCPVCCERFSLHHMARCSNNEAKGSSHSLCFKCFHRYMLETAQVNSLSCVPCPDPSCNSVFPIEVVRWCLSKFDQLRFNDREDEVNVRVALAARATLHCKCGTVGIVEKEDDVCNDWVSCPGCPLEFCIKCGNEYHHGQDCPPPAETLKWIKAETKPCPNCHMNIFKDGGCDHMHCKPPGGCGHHFYYSTGKPYPR